MIDRTSQLACSARDGLAYGLRLMRDRNGLVTFKARFHHTAFIVFPAFFTVLIAEVDLDAGNVLRQLAQSVFHLSFGLPAHLFMALDRAVSVDLDYHDFSPVLLAAALRPVIHSEQVNRQDDPKPWGLTLPMAGSGARFALALALAGRTQGGETG